MSDFYRRQFEDVYTRALVAELDAYFEKEELSELFFALHAHFDDLLLASNVDLREAQIVNLAAWTAKDVLGLVQEQCALAVAQNSFFMLAITNLASSMLVLYHASRWEPQESFTPLRDPAREPPVTLAGVLRPPLILTESPLEYPIQSSVILSMCVGDKIRAQAAEEEDEKRTQAQQEAWPQPHS